MYFCALQIKCNIKIAFALFIHPNIFIPFLCPCLFALKTSISKLSLGHGREAQAVRPPSIPNNSRETDMLSRQTRRKKKKRQLASKREKLRGFRASGLELA